MVLILTVIFSFTGLPKQPEGINKNTYSRTQIVTFDFWFTINNCTYHVVGVADTNRNTGFGTISRTCAGQNTQTIDFTIKNFNVIAPLKGVITVAATDLDDFIDSATETVATVSQTEREEIAKGITDTSAYE